jgi:O-antigen/teichoic acid export membrane protein
MLMFHTTGQTHLLSLAFLTGLLGMFEAVMLAKIRIRNQSARYAALSVAKFLLGALLNIYYIVVLRRGVEGLIIAGFILEALFASVYFFLLLPGLKFVFSLPVLKRMLKFGIPMVPSGVSSLLLVSVDRYFLQYFSTTAEVGLYSLGYNIGMVINLIVQALQLSWPAQMFASAKQPDAEHQFSKMLTYYLVVLGFAGLGLSVLTRGLLAIMTTSQFYEASKVVPLIVLSYILNGARMMTNTALTTQNRMKYIPPIVIASAVFNLGLNYLLIPRYGMMGAAWATVIAYLFLVVVQTAVNQHFWHIPYEYQRIVKIVLVWAIIYGSSFLTLTPSMWINICLKLILLAMYPLLLYGLGFYEEQELTALKGLYQSGMQYFRAWRMES